MYITEALRLHGSRLSDYERIEIDKYQEIYFLGLDACKINAKPGTALNSGYDDDNGSYNKVSIYFRCTTAGSSVCRNTRLIIIFILLLLLDRLSMIIYPIVTKYWK